MDVQIKALQTLAELETCCDIWLEASEKAHDFVDAGFWREKCGDMLEMYLPSSAVHLAYVGDTLAGFSATSENSLEALFVRPGMWGHGIGKALLLFLSSRHDVLHLAVYAKNKRAVTFYDRFGFIVTGTGTCSNTGENELYMEWKNPEQGEEHK